MKKLSLITAFLCCAFFSSFSQTEVWGYHSLAGKLGGGMVFKVDQETKDYQIINNFSCYAKHLYPAINTDFAKINNKLYGYTSHEIFSYDLESEEITFLKVIENATFSHVKDDLIYITEETGATPDTSNVYVYDTKKDSLYKIFTIPQEYGCRITGKWLEYEPNRFICLMRMGGTHERGTVVEINLNNNSSSFLFDFQDEKDPIGSPILHSNGKIYALLRNGVESHKLGCIIEINPYLKKYDVRASLNYDTGSRPVGELIEAADKMLYACTNTKGQFNDGCIIRFNPTTNQLQSLYHIDNTDSIFKYHKLNGNFLEYKNHQLLATLESKSISGTGKIISYDILNNTISVLTEFNTNSIYNPIGRPIKIDSCLYGIVQGDISTQKGGIYSFNLSNKEILYRDSIYINKTAVYGQNPSMLMQAKNGLLYGITLYGGKNNLGIIFSIDPLTNEFKKLRNIGDFTETEFIPSVQAFDIGNNEIIGLSYNFRYNNNKSARVCEIYKYNYQTDSLYFYYQFPESISKYAGREHDVILAKQTELITSTYQHLIKFDISNDSLSIILPHNASGINNLESYDENNILIATQRIYPQFKLGGITNWDIRNNTFTPILELADHIADTNIYTSINSTFKISDTCIAGIMSKRIDSKYYKYPFSYQINSSEFKFPDTIFNYSNIDYRNYSLVENNGQLTEINTKYNHNEIGEVSFIDFNNYSKTKISLEESPYIYTYNGYTYESNTNFDYVNAMDLIKVKIEQPSYIWTGKKDSLWYQDNNWFGAKMPTDNSCIIIDKNAPHFPVIDTNVFADHIIIKEGALLKIKANGNFRCNTLQLNGKLSLENNDSLKAVFISEQAITASQNTHINYIFNDKKKYIMGFPFNNLENEDNLDFTNWNYFEKNWKPLDTTNLNHIPSLVYLFEADSLQTMRFNSPLSWGAYECNIPEKTLSPIANPYTAFLNVDELNDLSNKAIYRFNLQDSCWQSYADGIGNTSSIIAPSDLIWLKSETEDKIHFENSDRLDKTQIDSDTNQKDKLLILSSSNQHFKDQTFIHFHPQKLYEFETKYDARKIIAPNKNHPNLFSYSDTSKLLINQLKDTSFIDLGFYSQTNGTFNIKIDHNTDFDFLILEDLIWNTKTDLLKGEYPFEYFTSDGNYPFRLYLDAHALTPLEESDFDVYYYPEILVIRSSKQVKNCQLRIVDLAGRVVRTKELPTFIHYEFPINIPTGHYIIQLINQDLIVNKKILVRK